MTIKASIYSSILIVGILALLVSIGWNSSLRRQSRSQDCFEYEIKIVQGRSMSPLLLEGSEVIVAEGFYWCHPVSRGDIVILDLSPGIDSPILIKRVVGVPGDTFDFIDEPDGSQRLHINGTTLANSEGKEYVFTRQNTLRLYEGAYGNGLLGDMYIVLGDDPGGSHDSSVFGLVGKEALIGKVLEVRE